MSNYEKVFLHTLLWLSLGITKMSLFRYSEETGDMRYGNVRFNLTGNKGFKGKLSNYVHFPLSVELFGKTYTYASNRHFTKDPVYEVEANFARKKYNAMLGNLLMEAKEHPERFRPF